jgi:hypothetical protein
VPADPKHRTEVEFRENESTDGSAWRISLSLKEFEGCDGESKRTSTEKIHDMSMGGLLMM